MQKSFIHLAVLLFLIIIVATGLTSCSKSGQPNNEGVDCGIYAADLDTALVRFSVYPTTGTCQDVQQAFNNIINKGCDPTGSYKNERDAFNQENNNCQ